MRLTPIELKQRLDRMDADTRAAIEGHLRSADAAAERWKLAKQNVEAGVQEAGAFVDTLRGEVNGLKKVLDKYRHLREALFRCDECNMKIATATLARWIHANHGKRYFCEDCRKSHECEELPWADELRALEMYR